MKFIGTVILVAAAAMTGVAFAAPASAASVGPVSSIAATWTPQLATSGTDGTVETVRQLVPCGNQMYAVGTFSQISRASTVYTRHNAFSFNATTGAVSAWNPNVSGMVVDSIALSPDCSTAYLGGKFTAIGMTSVRNIAAVSTATGRVLTTFAHNASDRVASLILVNGGSQLLAGGFFTSINGSSRPYMASLNPATGKVDGYVNLGISGNYQYVDRGGNPSARNATHVWNFSLSPDRARLLVMGDFTTVGGLGRRQIFMLNLGTNSATVALWNSSQFSQNCDVSEPFWLRAASWAPDGATVYIATTGYKPATGPGYFTANPRSGLCDAAAAFPSSGTNVAPRWVNYTGCDSLYSTAADASTVYVGGHERWADNSDGCDSPGSSAVAAPGMGGFDPTTGQLSFNPTRARGQGADDEVITSAGLWIASDNSFNSNTCGKTPTGAASKGHAGICFLPYGS